MKKCKSWLAHDLGSLMDESHDPPVGVLAEICLRLFTSLRKYILRKPHEMI